MTVPAVLHCMFWGVMTGALLAPSTTSLFSAVFTFWTHIQTLVTQSDYTENRN